MSHACIRFNGYRVSWQQGRTAALGAALGLGLGALEEGAVGQWEVQMGGVQGA